MNNNEHKTNLKFNLQIETEDVYKTADISVDFYVDIDELKDLIDYMRKYNIDPQRIKFEDLRISDEAPAVITRLYNVAYDIVYEKHLKDLMWTEEDLLDEVNQLMDTESLDRQYADFEMNMKNPDLCDSEEDYYEILRYNECVMDDFDDAYNNIFYQTKESYERKLVANDIIEFDGLLCELI